MAIISLNGMEYYAYHGCFDAERVVGTHFMVDLLMETDVESASKSDNLKETVNYLSVYQMVKQEMEVSSHLLEHVARRILESLHKNFPTVTYSEVTVSKLNPPLGGKLASVSVTLNSDEIEKG